MSLSSTSVKQSCLRHRACGWCMDISTYVSNTKNCTSPKATLAKLSRTAATTRACNALSSKNSRYIKISGLCWLGCQGLVKRHVFCQIQIFMKLHETRVFPASSASRATLDAAHSTKLSIVSFSRFTTCHATRAMLDVAYVVAWHNCSQKRRPSALGQLTTSKF